MRRTGFAFLQCALRCAIFLLLFGCHQQADTSSTVRPSAGTTITALIWAPDWPEEMLAIAAEFSRQNPDIHVDVQFMIGNSVEENIKPRIASGNLPDLISINPNTYAANLADREILVDVSHTVAWDSMLDPLKADWTSRTGRHFGIAGGVATTMIYYNEDIFRKASISRLPTSFDEFLTVCEQIKRAGYTPIVWDGGFPNMLGNGPFSSGFANNVVSRQPDWKVRINDGTLNLNTPQVADIFASIRLIPERGFVQPAFMTTGYDDGIRIFKEGKVAMTFHGSWAAGMLLSGSPFQVGLFIPPWNAPGRQIVPVIGSETGFAVTATSNEAAATRFLEFIAGPGFQIIQKRRRNISPFRQNAGPAINDERVANYTRMVSEYPVTGSPYYTALPSSSIERVHQLIQDVLVGKLTPRHAARLLDESVKKEAKLNQQ